MQVPGTISVAPVGRVDAPAAAEGVADARQEAFQRSLASMLGKTVQAEVLAKLTDGSFLVKVAGTPVRMMLPAGAGPGAELPMTVLTATPRPTFALASGETLPALPWTAPSPAAALLAKAQLAPHGQAISTPSNTPNAVVAAGAALAPAALLPGLDPAAAAAAPASLSATARLLSSVLGASNGAQALAGSAPLLPAQAAGAAPDPAQLARTLQQTVAQSGLFYESHLSEWAEGARSLPDLMREPQAHKAPGTPPTDPELARAINQQLTSHEQARVTWQGELGPGQPMQWAIHKDAPDGKGGADAPDAPTWRSGLRLRFAQLGEIEAKVVMSGQRLHIELQAGSDDVGRLLRAHAARFEAAMQAAGAPLSSLTIGQRAAPSDD